MLNTPRNAVKSSCPFILSLAIAFILLLGCTDTALAQNNTLLFSSTSLSFAYQTGATLPPAQQLLVSTSGGSLTVNATASTNSGGGWLSVSPTPGSIMAQSAAPATFSVAVNPAGLATGTYNGAITITAASGAVNSPSQIAVSLAVTSASQLAVSPGSLSFVYQIGGAAPAGQTLSISSSGSPLSFTAPATTSTGGPWLLASPASGTTPGAVTVSVNPAGLSAGTYNGAVTVTASGATGSPATIAVTLTVSSNPPLTISPASLQFNFQIGGAPPVNQVLSVSSGEASVSFFASPATNSGGGWLVASSSGVTPSGFNVAVNPTGLAAGTYTGSVTITASGVSNGPQVIPVTFTVSNSALLNVSSTSLAFNVQNGVPPPGTQTLTLSSTGAALPFTVSSATTAGGPWLLVGPLSGTTPGNVIVGVNADSLAPGTYAGSITVASATSGNGPQTVLVTLTVSNNPLLNLSPGSLSFAFQIGRATPASQTVSVTSTGVPLSFTASAATSSGGGWLAVNAGGATTTPGNLTVSVSPASLTSGTYSGSITMTAAGAGNSPQTVNVTLVVSQTALIVAGSSSLTFSAPVGATSTPIQIVSLTSTDSTPLSFTVSTTTSSGPWLLANLSSGTTASNLTVTANPTGLAAGTYTGSVVVTAPAAPNSPLTIPVTLTVSSSVTLVITPASLTFSQTVGGQAPPAQTLAVSVSGGAGLSFSATASISSGAGWLSVSPTSGTTPATLSVSVNGTSLSAGTYNGSITVVSAGAANSPQIISVTLTVSPAQPLFVTPGVLAFNYQIGASAPPSQALAVSAGSGASLSITASVNTGSGGTWLSVTPASGATPVTLLVSVSPSSLAAGLYTGTVTINSPSAATGPQIVSVALTVTAAAPPAPAVTAVVNAASFLPTAVAPGQIVTLFGAGIGPATAVGLRLNTAGNVDTSIGATRVLFDGNPAPMIYASSTQVSAVVPYEIAGRFSTRLEVEFQAVRSPGIDLKVVDTAPAIFTLNSMGTGQGAVLNPDFSVNGAAKPAAKGSVVMIYATGEGQTTPTGINGLVTGNVLRRPLQSVSVTIGGQNAEVLYQGAAPGLVAGVLQVNARIPANIASGSTVPVVVTIGNVNSQANVTLAVQ